MQHFLAGRRHRNRPSLFTHEHGAIAESLHEQDRLIMKVVSS